METKHLTGLHLLMDRVGFRARAEGEQNRALRTYVERIRAGDDAISVAAMLIIQEIRSTS